MMDKTPDIDEIDVKTSDSNYSESVDNDQTSQPTFKSITDIVFKGDKVIWIVFVILAVISIIEIFSASSTLAYKASSHWGPILRHSLFLLAGFGLILMMHNIPYRYYSSLIFVLIISVVLLLLTAKFGETVNGSERWLKIFGIKMQPSEIAKISLMGTIAFLLSKHDGINDGLLFKWMIGLMVLVTGIIALQNLSTALLLFLVCYLMMFIGNVKFTRLLKLSLAGIIFVALFFIALKAIPSSAFDKDGPLKRFSTWQSRLDKFGDSKYEEGDEKTFAVTKDNYQVAHAKIAISNGGLLGKFPGNSTSRDFLPQAYSDFIYAIILEELGLAGGLLVLMLYVVLLIRSGIIARRIDQLFPKYLVIGSALMLSIQALVNMAVAVNLIPVTGQPLPLVSRGGTSTIITCAYFGLILSADRFSRERKKRKANKAESSDNEEIEEIINADEKYKVIHV